MKKIATANICLENQSLVLDHCFRLSLVNQMRRNHFGILVNFYNFAFFDKNKLKLARELSAFKLY